MLGGLMTFAAVLYAQTSRSWRPWATAGFGAGLVLADKPYVLVAVAALTALLIAPFHRTDAATRRRWAIAFFTPLLAWAIALGWFDWTRTGSVTSTGRNEPGFTLAAPFNAVGFFVSPGKGLIYYSPVVVLGLLGLVVFWREQPRVARALTGAVAGATIAVAILPFWSDETWGPRYIVWIAWALLIPVPWWATTTARRRVLGVVVALAVAIQLLPVVSSPATLGAATMDLTGQPIFRHSPTLHTPFGRDPVRWIPELSPLLFQAKLVLSFASVRVGGPPITTRYAPYEGEVYQVTMDRARLDSWGFGRPTLWWFEPSAGGFRAAAAAFALLGAAALALLMRLARSPKA